MKLNRIHGMEWLIALGGLTMLIGLALPWRGAETGFGGFGLLELLLVLAGITALVLPAVVAVSRLTDVPIVWETLLWLASLILLVVVLIQLIGPPDGGYGGGYWLALAGLVVVGLAGWRSVRREN